MKQTMLVLLTLALVSCGNNNCTDSKNYSESTIFNQYSPQIWVNKFLSEDRMDTLKVLLWSNEQNGFLDSIPVDTTVDWPAWYQQNRVDAVLMLGDVEPLHISYCHSLYYCNVLQEQGKRAIAIIPGASQWSNNNVCFIYTIRGNKWCLMRHFGILSSFTHSEDGEETELTRKWLINRNGKWMYCDYDKYLTEEDSTYHNVFTKSFRKEITDWDLKYKGREYTVKGPGYIKDNLKKYGLLPGGQSKEWMNEGVSYHAFVDLNDCPDDTRYLVIGGLAGIGSYYVCRYLEEEPEGATHVYFNYVTSNDTFDISYPTIGVGIDIVFDQSVAEKVGPDSISLADRMAFANAVTKRDNWKWGQPLTQWGVWRPIYITNK